MATNWPGAVAVALMSLAAAETYAADGDIGPGPRTLAVRTYNRVGVSAHDPATAEATAARLFEDIGIRVVWTNCGAGGREVAGVPAHCDETVAAEEVIVRICAAGPRDVNEPASMGFALVTPGPGGAGVLATVFADRVFDVARAAGVDPRPLLGLAIGHEL